MAYRTMRSSYRIRAIVGADIKASGRLFSKLKTSYDLLVKNKKITSNPRQLQVIDRLDELEGLLLKYDSTSPVSSALSWWCKPKSGGKNATRGVYIYGNTGCGKSLLMDLFYENTHVHVKSKTRIHFHSFMLEVHHRLHEHRLSKLSATSDPLRDVASQLIIDKGFLLCLDEFQVTDVADAMILKRLFTHLFDGGAVIVATSNRTPDDLYLGGLNRSNFLPFIPLLKEHCDPIDMSDIPDYRMLGSFKKDSYLYPLSESVRARLEYIWQAMKGSRKETSLELSVMMGRTIQVRRAFLSHYSQNDPLGSIQDHQGSNAALPLVTRWEEVASYESCCFFHFNDLCDAALGAADYLAVAKAFSIVVISDIPSFKFENRNQMRRFITLLDVFYDHKVRLVCSASAQPINLVKFDTSPQSHPTRSNSAVKLEPEIAMVDEGGSSGRTRTMVGHVEWSGTGRDVGLADLVSSSAVSSSLRDPLSYPHHINIVTGNAASSRESSGSVMVVGSSGSSGSPSAGRVEDELFAFHRAVSRLMEMQSPEYFQQASSSRLASRYGNIT